MASVMSAVIDWFRPAAWTLNRRSRSSGRLNVTFRCSFTCFSVARVSVTGRVAGYSVRPSALRSGPAALLARAQGGRQGNLKVLIFLNRCQHHSHFLVDVLPR